MPLLTFFGAARTVTGSKYLLETGEHRVLVDCGLFQGTKDLRRRNWNDLPVKASTIDAVVLTHAHLDHVGYLPRLVAQGFSGRVFCTPGTQDLATLVLPDSAHLQEEDARQANAGAVLKPPPRAAALHRGRRPAGPRSPAAGRLRPARARGARHRRRVRPAGPPPGLRRGRVHLAGRGRTLLFGGDLGRYGRPVLPDPMPIAEADVLLVNPLMATACTTPTMTARGSRTIITETVAGGGRVIIPSFAIGRVEEVLYWIRRLEDEQRIPVLPVYLDSPMAIEGASLLRRRAPTSSIPSSRAGASWMRLLARARFEMLASPQAVDGRGPVRPPGNRPLLERDGHGRPRAPPPRAFAAGSEEHGALRRLPGGGHPGPVTCGRRQST